MLGIAKAYTTRVGEGPFPTELHNDIGALIGERGREFGTVTGPQAAVRLVRRRAGAPDGAHLRDRRHRADQARHARRLREIKVCVGYRLDGETIDHLPASQAAQARVEPVYETIEGWRGSTAGARSWAALPAQAIKYVRRIEELIGAPVALLSTSPEREDTILVQNPFEG